MSPRTSVAAATIALGAGAALVAGCSPAPVELPDVVGTPVSEAVDVLEEAGFVATLVGLEEPEDNWKVYSQSPDGETLRVGETVRLQAHSLLESANESCGVGTVGDGGRSLNLDMAGEESSSGELVRRELVRQYVPREP